MKVDMVVMRHSNPGAAYFLSKNVQASIVNAGDGAHEHPTQALLDSFTIREHLGEVAGKKVVIVGDILHSRVALSNIFALQMQGAEVMVCGPKTLIPKYITELGVKYERSEEHTSELQSRPHLVCRLLLEKKKKTRRKRKKNKKIKKAKKKTERKKRKKKKKKY